MPATRSRSTATRLNSLKPTPTPSPQRGTRHNCRSESLSVSFSDDCETTMPLTVKRKDTQQQKRPAATDSSEVIEISDDDDDDALPRHLNSQTSMIADFRRQISKLREESVKHKKDHERAVRELKILREENQQLQALRKPGTLIDVAKLTDNMDCEICTSRLWEPYSLPECGHIFCQSCLQDWFGTTLAQFMNANPHYNVNQAQNVPHLQHLFQNLVQNPHAAAHPQVAAMLANLLPPSPQYTCPTCREPVRTRPIEVFALKAIVRVVTAATGESSPKKTVGKNWKGKAGPWDGFFPPKKT